LLKNLDNIFHIIKECNLFSEIIVCVSDNASTDNTITYLNQFKKMFPENFTFYSQFKNLGLERNALFLLEKAQTEFVMFLGDDDFFSREFLSAVIDSIRKISMLNVIIPSYINIDINGDNFFPVSGRDHDKPNIIYNKSFKSLISNSWRGHQLSGITFSKKDIYNKYINRKVQNLYPFIFFVSISLVTGKAYHLTTYPIKVTQPGQENKFWSYGKFGLLPDIFNNYKYLYEISYFKRVLLQLYIIYRQKWRLFLYSNSKKNFIFLFETMWGVTINKNTLFLTKILLQFFFVFNLIELLFSKLLSFIKK
jgi:hypothetical protein